MSGIPVTRKTGVRSYPCAENIVGGQLVEARAAGRVGVAAAGSVKVLGVAIADGVTPESFQSGTAVINGRPTLNAAPFPDRVGVAYSGDELPVTYVAAAAFGDKLIAAAAGKVTPAGATPDARSIVGTCTEPAGVAAGVVGPMRTV